MSNKPRPLQNDSDYDLTVAPRGKPVDEDEYKDLLDAMKKFRKSSDETMAKLGPMILFWPRPSGCRKYES